MLGAYILRLHLTLPQALLLLAGWVFPAPSFHARLRRRIPVCGCHSIAPFGFTRSDALAYILVAQAFNYVVVTVWGLPGLLLSRK